jgi:hypothetical protein
MSNMFGQAKMVQPTTSPFKLLVQLVQYKNNLIEGSSEKEYSFSKPRMFFLKRFFIV